MAEQLQRDTPAESGEGKRRPETLFTRDDLDQLRKRLESAVDRVCPAWLAAQRDDIVQEAMLRVLKILDKRDADASVNARYLWRVGYSATIDEIRRARAKREVPMDESSPDRESTRADADPIAALRSKEIQNGLRGCLGDLADGRRRAVTLYLQGHRLKEVATFLDKAPKNAENLVYRGLADLRGCLQGKGITL